MSLRDVPFKSALSTFAQYQASLHMSSDEAPRDSRLRSELVTTCFSKTSRREPHRSVTCTACAEARGRRPPGRCRPLKPEKLVLTSRANIPAPKVWTGRCGWADPLACRKKENSDDRAFNSARSCELACASERPFPGLKRPTRRAPLFLAEDR